MSFPDDVVRRLHAAHAEALRVGDSPLRADRLADTLPALSRAVEECEADDDSKARVRAALADAERVLRRDDDGREAARHLDTAIKLTGPIRSRAPNPFLD